MFGKHEEPIFFAGNHCDHIVEVIRGNTVAPVTCCGAALSTLLVKDREALQEKHLPVIQRDKNKILVAVGSIYHPMEEKHSIGFVYLKTKKGCQRVDLAHTDKPIAEFVLTDDDEPIAAYAFCNLHGFWKTDIK